MTAFKLKMSKALGLPSRSSVAETPRAETPPAPTGKSAPGGNLSTERPPSIEGIIDDVLEARTVEQHFFRPSMLFGCKRANVFHYTRVPHHPQRQNPRMLRILDNGTAIHSVLQGYLADHPDWWFAPESRILVKVQGATIRGSCDGVLIRREDGYRVGVEIKSISHDQFIKLTKPKPEHVFQAGLYCRLQKLPWIVIIYWDKNTQHLKEYVVRYNPQQWEDVKERVKELYGYVQSGELPEYDASTCDTTFCATVDYCRSKGAPV